MVWLPGGLAAAGEGAGERVGETLHPAIRLLVEAVRARCSVSILGTIELPSSSFRVALAGAPREATAYDWGGRGSDDEAGEDGDDGDDDRPFYAGISIDGAAWLVPTATATPRNNAVRWRVQ